MPPEASGSDTAAVADRHLKALRWWRAAIGLAAAAGVALALYAAAPLLNPRKSDEATLRGLQVRVLTISQAAAENRLDGVLAALDALDKDLDDAATHGLISLPRYRSVEAAVEAVRADVAGQLVATAATAADAPAATASEDSSVPDAQQQTPVEAPQPAIVPIPAPVPVQAEPALPDAAKEAREAKGKGKGPAKP